MQAYARAELLPLEPSSYGDEVPSTARVAVTRDAATATSRYEGGATANAVVAALLGALDENALSVLAGRLAPHLNQLVSARATRSHAAYTVATLAAELGVSQKAIRCAIGRGELQGVKRGSRWIISSDAVTAWATALPRRRSVSRRRAASAPKTAGPSLRSVLCDPARGGVR